MANAAPPASCCGSAAHTPAISYATAQPAGYGTPGVPGTAGAPGDVAFSQQELEYYEALFSHVDKERKGYVDSLSGGHFLMSSGLPQGTLRTVWEIADSANQGILSPERFFVALRLVAHAQASRQLAPSLVMVDPPVLPDFQGYQRRRAPSECSGGPSMLGAPSEISELQPVIASGEDQVRRAAEFARSTAKSVSPREPRWGPSQREKRKYASLFKRTDGDNDGFVEGWEAKQLLERSKLDVETLKLTWEHADQNHDGKLDFREFVVLVHMVACVMKGLPLPDPREGLPPELANTLSSLEPADVLIVQREMSRSRSPSPGASGRASPAFMSTPAIAPAVAPPETSPSWSPAAQFNSLAADEGARWTSAGGSGRGSAPPSPAFVGFREIDAADVGGDCGIGATGSVSASAAAAAAVPANTETEGFGGFGADWGATGGFDTLPEPESRKEEKTHKKKKKGKSRDPPLDRDHGGGFGASAAPLDDGGLGTGWGDGFGDPAPLGSSTGSPLVPSSSALDAKVGQPGATKSAEFDDWAGSSAFPSVQPLDQHQEPQHPQPQQRGRSHSRDMDGFGDGSMGFGDSHVREARDVHHSRERERERERGHHKDTARADLTEVVKSFESVIAADRAVSRQLRREVDDLEVELQQIRDAQQQLERQLQHEQQEAERLAQQRRQLEGQGQDAKRRLAELRDDRRQVNLESISLRRDRCHFAEELTFLKRTAEDEEKTLEVIRRANQFLDKSYRDLEIHTEQLETQRKELLQEVNKEKDLVRAEERQSAEMRNRLDRMRREYASTVSEKREANLREQRVREMQADSPPAARLGDGNCHSWAHKVMASPGDTASGIATVAPAAMVGSTLAGVPGSGGLRGRGGSDTARGSFAPGATGPKASVPRGAVAMNGLASREGV
eukprot:TRINITY_DN1781_c0_g1_i2.p1 TRINITY_DN1781_c0_g1~~TRINITY_DN1781_c0_g1_i2.p1  ORF type:complete len:972 (+),score=146.35 TRINITY_DN1781_c0_g1_i2:205-2916(+)